MADSLSELTMHWSCVERRLLVDGVKTPHNGTLRSHHNVLVFVEGDGRVQSIFAGDLYVAVRREGLRGRRQ